jgi:hypothetical protein
LCLQHKIKPFLQADYFFEIYISIIGYCTGGLFKTVG